MSDWIPKNNVARLEATFKNISDTNTDPSEVIINVVAPDGTATAYTGGQLTNSATGVYHVDVLLDQSGIWRWSGKGDDALGETLVAYGETVLHVRDGAID